MAPPSIPEAAPARLRVPRGNIPPAPLHEPAINKRVSVVFSTNTVLLALNWLTPQKKKAETLQGPNRSGKGAVFDEGPTRVELQSQGFPPSPVNFQCAPHVFRRTFVPNELWRQKPPRRRQREALGMGRYAPKGPTEI